MAVTLRLEIVKAPGIRQRDVVPFLDGVQRAILRLENGGMISGIVNFTNEPCRVAYYEPGKKMMGCPVPTMRREYGSGLGYILHATWAGAHEAVHLVEEHKSPESPVFSHDGDAIKVPNQVWKEITKEIRQTGDLSGNTWVKQREIVLRQLFNF